MSENSTATDSSASPSPSSGGPASASPRGSKAGRIWLAAVGLFLAGAGAFFSWVLWKSYDLAMETRSWNPIPCVISGSEMEEVQPAANSGVQYRTIIKFSYLINEEGYSSYRIRRQDARLDPDDPNNTNPKMSFVTKDKFKAEEALSNYPTGRNLICFVNPNNPKEAVLEHGTKAGLYSIWFPLLFVAGGLGIFINMLLPHSEDKKTKAANGTPEPSVGPSSDPAS